MFIFWSHRYWIVSANYSVVFSHLSIKGLPRVNGVTIGKISSRSWVNTGALPSLPWVSSLVHAGIYLGYQRYIPGTCLPWSLNAMSTTFPYVGYGRCSGFEPHFLGKFLEISQFSGNIERFFFMEMANSMIFTIFQDSWCHMRRRTSMAYSTTTTSTSFPLTGHGPWSIAPAWRVWSKATITLQSFQR